MVTHQPKFGHPPEESILQTWNLALRLNLQTLDQVTTAKDGHLLPRVVTPSMVIQTILRMATYQPKDGHPPEGSKLKSGNFSLRLLNHKIKTR